MEIKEEEKLKVRPAPKESEPQEMDDFLNHPSWQPIGNFSAPDRPVATPAEITSALHTKRQELLTRRR